tara:strand:- start:3126 stop:3704 length:579 start_codon:yes stop_codon:yes gene_type:complete
MGSFPIYLADSDADLLVDRLNKDEQIAFFVPREGGGWIAASTLERFDQPQYRYTLWHVPSGPPRLRGPEAREIADPWAGWDEPRPGADPVVPYFGPGEPRTFRLTLRLHGTARDPTDIGLSGFEWIGDHYRSIGNPAPDGARRWWNRFRSWAKRNAKRVPRGGLSESTPGEIWAFPVALKRMEQGCRADSYP